MGIISKRLTILTLTLIAAAFATSSASASTFVVTANEDEPDADPGDGLCASAAGRCTLRAAIEESNADYDFDTVYVSPERYVLDRGPLVFNSQVEVSGRNADWTVIDAQRTSRVIELAPRGDRFVYARLTAITIENGYAGAPGSRGGAISIPEPQSLFALTRCIVRNSFAASGGGGIYNAGNLEVTRSAIVDNDSDPEAVGDWAAAGGAIFNEGYVTIVRSSIAGNAAVRGGGLANDSGTANILNSTFNNNVARETGGAIWNGPGERGVRAFTDIAFGTIVDNSAGGDPWAPGQAGGIFNAGGLQLASTILGRNTDHQAFDAWEHAPDCLSESLPGQSSDDVDVTSAGGVIVSVINDRCVYDLGPYDHIGSAEFPLDPGLPSGTSSAEGEVTFGFEPLEGGAAVDQGGEEFCSYEDQWGYGRPAAGSSAAARCDAGAIEKNGTWRRRSVMMAVGDRVFRPSDLILAVQLSANGFDVFDDLPADVVDEADERDLLLISETISSSQLPSSLASLGKPILVLEPAALDNFGMTAAGWDRTQGIATNQSVLRVVDDGRVDSSYVGELEVSDSGARLGWGVPAADAWMQAELLDAPGRWAIFGYDAGAQLADGSRAPAARVAFFAAEGTPERMNYAGWNLLSGLLFNLVPPR